MLNNFYFTILFFKIFLVKISFGQFDYYKTLETNSSLINSTFSTVVISESQDIGICTCDLTPGSCDYLCCCDADCPSKVTSIWISDPKNICLDKKNTENDYLTRCFNEDILFYFNRKRGMKEYRDPVSNLFCVTFDNSSIMGKFYKDITTLQKASIDAIYKNYVDIQVHNYPPTATITDIMTGSSYTYGDYIKVRNNEGRNDFIFDGKFFTYGIGTFGECIKNNPVRFMIPNEKITCGMKFKPFMSCANENWQNYLNTNFTFATSKGLYATYVRPTVDTILIRDYTTGILSVGSMYQTGPTAYTSPNGADCICNNVVENAEFKFIFSTDYFTITKVIINLILGTNIKYECNKNFIMSQTFSTSFLNNNTNTFIRSGSPGYLTGKRLLTAKNTTVNGVNQFQSPKEGIYMIGRKVDGTCAKVLENNKLYLQSLYDTPILFNVNSVYSCTDNFNLNDFKIFCQDKLWKMYSLYDFVYSIQYVGTFGSANIAYLKDWSQVIFDYNLDNSTWTESNKTCYFPRNIYLDLLTSKAGAVNNPQEFIISARISVKYESISFLSNDKNEVLPFNMRLLTNFIPLNEDQISASRNTPNIIPGLPVDIMIPIVENN